MFIRMFVAVLIAVFGTGSQTHAEEAEPRQVPGFVLRMANAQIPGADDNARHNYCELFLFGYLYLEDDPGLDDAFAKPELLGISAGIDYRDKNPETLHQVLTGFGYQKIQRTGVWSAGFERSLFLEGGGDLREGHIWLGALPDAVVDGIQWRRRPLPQDAEQSPEALRSSLEEIHGHAAFVVVTVT